MKETLLTTCENDQKVSVGCYDYVSTSKLQTYNNGGTVALKGLLKLGDDYIVAAESNKPLLHVWPINSQEELKSVRFVLPDVARAVDVTPNGCYLAAGITNKVYLWHLSSGELLSVQQKHYQDITCVKFSADGDYLVVGGQDGMLVTYNCAHLICNANKYLTQTTLGQVDPLYAKLDHSMSVSDVFVGNFGGNSRVGSVSCDQTCRLYTLSNGFPLLTLVFDCALSTLTIDSVCWNLYVATTKGLIENFSLQNPPRTLQHFATEDKERKLFKGHQKKVNCLDLNASSDNLISGGDDHFVFIWEVKTRQVLRKIEHKGAVLNVKCTFNLKCESGSFKPKTIIVPLKRNLDSNLKDLCISHVQHKSVVFSDDIEDDESDVVETLQKQLNVTKEINMQLYSILAQNLL